MKQYLDFLKHILEKGERRTIIVRGGPGSGKSIVAINALGQLMHPKNGSERRNACYAGRWHGRNDVTSAKKIKRL